jgi:O-antigen/teichoic acid export membrane protein
MKSSLLDFKTDKATIKKSAINGLLIQLLVKMKGIITMPIITYYLVPSEMGAYNLISVTAAMLIPLFSLNLTDGPAIHLVQEKSKEKIVDMYNTVVNSVIIISIVFSLVLVACGHFLGEERQSYLPAILLIILSSVFYKVATYVLAVFQKSSTLVTNTLIRDILATVLTIVLVMTGFSFYGIVGGITIANLVAALLVWRMTRKDLPYRIFLDRTILRDFLKMAIPLLPVFLFSWVVQSSDSYFLAYLKGEESVGKYAVVYGLTNVILCFTYALNLFWFPVSARLWVEDREKYRGAFTVAFAGFVVVLLSVVCLFELNSSLLIELFARRESYHDAHVIMGVIAFAFSMQVLITLLTAPLYSNRNAKAIFCSYVAGGILNIILNGLLIPGMGIIGAALSTALSYLVIVVIMGGLNFRMAKFNFFDNRLKALIPILVGLWILSWWTRWHLSLSGILVADVLFVGFVALSFYLLVLRDEEKRYLSTAFTNYCNKLRMVK